MKASLELKRIKHMRLLYLAILIVYLLSCEGKTVNAERESIEIKEYEFTDELRETKRGSLTLIKDDSKVQFSYNETDTDSTFDYSLTQDLNNDSILIYDNDKEICYLTDQRSYPFNDQQIRVKKYRYDLVTSVDEEASLYFIDNYGLIGIVGVEGHSFLSKGTDLDIVIIKFLESDETGFFNLIIPAPLPSLIDSLSSDIDLELETIK